MAAGLGTRLKPWTEHHPKALVPVGGVPMLRRVVEKLRGEGFDDIVINVHHFSDQIREYVEANDFGVRIRLSDESDLLLDTGGGIANAAELLDGEPFLVHNVDILSDAPLRGLMEAHKSSGNGITLLTSDRSSSRRLVFDPTETLRGWHNTVSGEYRPSGFAPAADMKEAAFSGIYVVSPKALAAIREYGNETGGRKFPIMDFLLSGPQGISIRRHHLDQLNLIDIGKPDTLEAAGHLFGV